MKVSGASRDIGYKLLYPSPRAPHPNITGIRMDLWLSQADDTGKAAVSGAPEVAFAPKMTSHMQAVCVTAMSFSSVNLTVL